MNMTLFLPPKYFNTMPNHSDTRLNEVREACGTLKVEWVKDCSQARYCLPRLLHSQSPSCKGLWRPLTSLVLCQVVGFSRNFNLKQQYLPYCTILFLFHLLFCFVIATISQQYILYLPFHVAVVVVHIATMYFRKCKCLGFAPVIANQNLWKQVPESMFFCLFVCLLACGVFLCMGSKALCTLGKHSAIPTLLLFDSGSSLCCLIWLRTSIFLRLGLKLVFFLPQTP